MRKIEKKLIAFICIAMSLLLLGFNSEIEVDTPRNVPPVQLCTGSVRVIVPSIGEFVASAQIFDDSITGRRVTTHSVQIVRLENGWRLDYVRFLFSHPNRTVLIEYFFVRDGVTRSGASAIHANNCSFIWNMPFSCLIEY